MTLELRGLAIGAVLSGACVSIHLGSEEHKFFNRDAETHARLRAHNFVFPPGDIHQWLSWRRYVDDVLACSRVLCSVCIVEVLKLCYAEKLSIGFANHLTSNRYFEWVDLELHLIGQIIIHRVKYHNKAWLYPSPDVPLSRLVPAARPRPTLVPWFGAMPQSFSTLRSFLLARLLRGLRADSHPWFTVVGLLEIVLEMKYICYPSRLVRALVHALPDVYVTRALRPIVRKLARTRPIC